MVLYVSAEESAQQVRLRWQRLEGEKCNLKLLSETDLDLVLQELEALKPSVAIIDRTNYGRGAQAKAVIEDGSIVRVIVTSPGIGYCGQGVGVGIVTAITPTRPGIGYTSGDTIDIFDPVYPKTPITTVPVGVTTNNGSIVDAYIPTDFSYEFNRRPILVINSDTGLGAELVPVMLDVVQSVVDDSATRVPLIGISTVIDCPTEDHRSNV